MNAYHNLFMARVWAHGWEETEEGRRRGAREDGRTGERVGGWGGENERRGGRGEGGKRGG